MYNPYLTREEKRGSQSKAYWRSKKQELQVAERMGGRATPASGSKHKKGDISVTDICRIECKSTQRKSFSITREMVNTIANAGLANNEVPVIVVEFLDDKGTPEEELAVIPMKYLEYLILCIQQKN
jgi:hypothetical protein